MTLYNILMVFFLIGGIGIALINRKSNQFLENKKRWKKYFVYLVLVFGQLFLIQNKNYSYFSLCVLLFGFYEILKIAKSKKMLVICLFFYSIFGWFFYSFFAFENVFWQQFVFIIVITFDGYSQLFGQLFGKTKLFPIVSPNKTLEGFFGGVISVVFISIILSNFLSITIEKAIVFGLIIAIFSVIGDYLASLYKRLNNIKDYSQLIPNHGGFLDRFDSLIFASFGFGFLLKIDFSNPVFLLLIEYSLIFMMIFLISEIAYHSLNYKVEITRKFTHFSSGVVCLSFPFYINNHWLVLILCSSFMMILFLSQKFNKLQSINSIDRKSYGSLLFPVSVYCCFLVHQFFDNNKVYFYLPILILAICDPIAALIGKKFPFGKYKVGNDYKTIMGSLAFFITCFTILFSSFYDCEETTLALKCILVSIVVTFVEGISKNGFDNLTIPLVSVFMLSIIDFILINIL